MGNYVMENGLYCYGPRFWYKKDTGEIVSSSPQIIASWLYWDNFGDFGWPPLRDGGYTEKDVDVLSLPYVPGWNMPGIPKIIKDREVIYDSFPDPEPLPEPEDTQVQRLNRQIAEQEVRLGDVEIMLADVVMGGGD